MGGLWRTLGSAIKGGVIIVIGLAVIGIWFASCEGGV